ncbi:MAG: stage II sporulation protein P [Oscillospiraceae bacterium]|nr:stage II sporulation protein P [Oscillospiraceae bacterium]MBQ2157091.1 stage II sporulation protein P [Oscillospiraceae bacterium]
MMSKKVFKKLQPFLRLIFPLAAVLTAVGSMLLASSAFAARAKELFWSSSLPELIISAELRARVTVEKEDEPEPSPAPEPEPGAEEPVPDLIYTPRDAGGEESPPSEEEKPEPQPQPESGGTLSAGNIEIKNKTDYSPDIETLLNSDIDFSGVTVLIIHSHATEAYMPDGENSYVASDPFRTLNEEQNVLRVGEELKSVLEARGIKVIHDTGLYDYPNYNLSYSRALSAIKTDISEYPDIGIVIDLHRDALEGKDGTVYKTVADVGDSPCAQVGFVVGTNASGLKHPNWEKNLAFALKIQYSMCEKYPSLARPIKLSQYRYNQHATEGSLIVEVGCTGNTLPEALAAVRYFGDCLADVIER